MDRITSVSNPHIRGIRDLEKKKKKRLETGTFVCEGLRMVKEIPKDYLLEVYLSDHFLSSSGPFPVGGGVRAYSVTDEVMHAMADTDHPQGILAVAKTPSFAHEDLPGRGAPLLLLLENIQDPGNLGTMIRTAEGAGATGIVLSPGTADPFQPKVVRSTMGSLFRVPLLPCRDEEEWEGTLSYIRSKGVKLFAAYLSGSVPYDRPVYISGTAFLIGNEGNGLREETAAMADERIRIPMGGRLESLNAAMSAGILLYEAARQRRKR